MTFRLPGSTSLRFGLHRALSLSTLALVCFAPVAFGETTTTTLIISAKGVPLTTVRNRTVVKLTAVVKARGSRLTVGQVEFCDASFTKSCLNFRQVGMAQLTKDGTATLRFIPGPGAHTYKAVFLGTATDASSSSAVSSLTVAGGPVPHVTTTSISASGSNGSYTLTANLTGPASALPLIPGGQIFFVDRGDPGYILGSPFLPTDLPAINYIGFSQPLSDTLSTGVNVDAGWTVGDFNGDGRPDVVVCKKTACPAVEIGDGDNFGGFREPRSQPKLVSTAYRVQKGDFNSDGRLDLVVSYGRVTGSNVTYSSYFLEGAGDGTFLEPTEITLESASGTAGTAEGVADFNKDGIPDLVVSYTTGTGIALGNGDGSFRNGWTKASGLKGQFVVGDFDGDGFQDFAAVAGGDTHHISVFFGSASATFEEVDLRAFGVVNLAGGDFKGEGTTEITATSYEYDVDNFTPGFAILHCHPDRTFTTRQASGIDPRYDESDRVFIDDFNRDGIADAALLAYSSTSSPAISQVILLGNRDGTFSQPTRIQSPTGTSLRGAFIFGTADFNGDGVPDVAATGTQNGTGYAAYGAFVTQVGQTAVATIRPPAGAGDYVVFAKYRGDSNFYRSNSEPVRLSDLPQGSPAATLSSSYVQFGEAMVSEPSNAKTVVLTNKGSGALLINMIGIKTGYDSPLRFATSNNCPASLAAGAACKIRVRFVGECGVQEVTALHY